MRLKSNRSTLLSTIGRWCPFALLLVAATAGINGAAWAQITVEDGCLEEAAGFGVNCTANDVGIAEAINIEILDPFVDPEDPGCAFLGDTVTFSADFRVDLTAQARHDLGIYFSRDGDPSGTGARTGQCYISTVPFSPEPTWLDLDGTTDDPNGLIQDTCGDIDASHNPLYPTLTLTVPCVDVDGDNVLDLPYCTSWRQPGANDLCTVPEDAYPGSPAKCKCDPGFEVPIYVPPPTLIEVVKDLTPSDDPGLFDLQIDGTTEADDVGDGGTTGSISVAAGDRLVGEIAGAGTDLSRYSSSISCVERGESTVLFSCSDCTTLLVNMPETGGDYVCTITNELKQGSITVIKQVVNDNGGTAVESDFTVQLGDPGNTTFPGAPSPGTKTDFDAGVTFDVTEDMGSLAGQYSATFTGDCTGAIEAGVEKTCTITNDDDPPSLTLTKIVTNNSGGTAVATDWTLSASGPTPISGAGGAGSDATFSAGTYSLSESGGPSGYTPSVWSCTGGTQNGSQITVGLGESASCSITNDDDPPSLTLTKIVTNNNGGTAVTTDWTLSASGPTPISGAGSASSDASFSAGTYTLGESAGPSGYSPSAWSCTGGTQNGNQIAVGLGESASCSITNDDDLPSLTLTKIVTNDNGGTAVATDWTLLGSGPTPISGAGGASSDVTFSAGTYTLSESGGPSGYTPSAWSCTGGTQDGSQITVGLGESASCSITNDDDLPSLSLTKIVTNNNGGTAVTTDWTLSASGPTPISGAGGTSSDATFSAGTYTLSESTGPSGYTPSAWSCTGGTQNGSQITVGLGESASCSITNDDDLPSLSLTKIVTNNNGGTAVTTDWTLSASGPTPISGAGGTSSDATFSAGTYTLSESTGPSGYTPSAWSCTGGTQDGSQITVGLGESASCSITNDDGPPGLTLTKIVTNDNGGTAVATDWMLSASGPTPISGAGGASSGATFSAGTYSLSESTGPSGYTPSAWSCTGGTQDGSQITVGLGESASCSITNNDDLPSLSLTKIVTNNNGGTAVTTDWTLSASGPTPISGAGGASSDATFSAGTYTLSESTGPSGYTPSSWSCTGGTQNGSQITVGLGESASCSITNDDDLPSLILTKIVTNNNGGTAVVTDWSLSAAGPTPISGAGSASSDASFSAGTYTLSESGGPSGYTPSAWSCTGGTQNGSQITVGLGESASCSITNDDDLPSLTLTKIVTNNNGGTAVVTDWTLSAAGPTPISGAGSASSDASFSAGTYTLSESTGPSGYTPSAWSCSGGTQSGDSITVELGESASCSITNDDMPAGLTLTKIVTNNNGGTAVVTDWTLSAAGPTPISGAGGASSDASFSAGTYTLSESGGPSSYTPSAWSCTGGTQNGSQITVGLGESASCSITNDDDLPSLTLTKIVTNNNGGTAVATEWTLSASGPTPISGAGGASGDASFSAGTYTLSESGGPSGYTPSAWSCTGGTQNGSQITVGLGESVSCSITNDDVPPGLILTKIVTNNNGGTAVTTDWTLSASGPTPISGAGGASSGASFSAGTYSLSESTGPSGYTPSAWSCTGGTQNGSQITVGLGESASCSITNDDDLPSLTLTKIVTNNNGGTAVTTDWTLSASGPTPISGAGGASSDATFSAGTYTLSESGGPSGYTPSTWSCTGGTQDGSQITVGLGESASCSITNDDNQPSLTLTKIVTNNNGGTAVTTDWTLSASGPTPISGAGGASSDATFSAGTYALSESTGPSGYTPSAWSCTGGTQNGSQITVGLGESASCSITNDDDLPSLTLTKIVTNNNGGAAVTTDWTLSASGPTPVSGAGGASSDATFSAGTYALSESTGPSGYTPSAWSCTGGTQNGSQITVGLGESASCSITNDDDLPSLTLTKIVSNDNGGTAVAAEWLLSASGPTPISGAGGAVSDATFSAGTYTLSESGGPSGYSPSAWSCTGTQNGNQIAIGLGESASCSITNDDIAPQLTIYKVVVGDAPSSPWIYTAPGVPPGSDSFTIPAAGGSAVFSPNAGRYTVSEDVLDTGADWSEWALTSVECQGVIRDPQSPDRGATFDLPLGVQADCTFTNRYAALEVEKSCVNTEPAIGDTVVFSIQTMNRGVVSLPVTLGDEIIPAIDGVQYVLEAGDGVCELSEFEDSPGDPDAGGADGCVEFVEPVLIEFPFFDVENQATLSASMLGEPFADIAVSLEDMSDAVCDVPGPATRTRGFWGNRIAREDASGLPTADGFTCFAFENWVLPEFSGGVDLGWSAPPVATCEQLAASFFSHPSKNSDNSRRRRSCQTNYKVTIDVMVLILNTWLPQNGEPLPGDDVPVREKDVFDLFPWPSGDGVLETSMVDLIDEILSALGTDHLTDGTPCSSSCKRSLAGLADMIANSGDDTAIIIDGEELPFGGDYHAYPQASRALGEDSVEQFDCGSRNNGGGPRTQDDGPRVIDTPSLKSAPTEPILIEEETIESAPRGRNFDARALADRDPPSIRQESVDDAMVVDQEAIEAPDPDTLQLVPVGRELWSRGRNLDPEPEDRGVPAEEADLEVSGVAISSVDMRLDESRTVLGGSLRFSAAEAVAAGALWLNEVSLTVLERQDAESDWIEIGSSVDCRLDSGLPVDVTNASKPEGVRVRFTCDLASPAAVGATVRLRVEAVDGLGLQLQPRDQATEL